jgi:K+-sensing histidine kinase KdpD
MPPTGNKTSTRLGLAIGEEIAELHCGKMYAENLEDRLGARLTIELDMQLLAVCT